MEYHFEPLSEAHRGPVIDLFNHYIAHSHAAFLEAPVDYEFFSRFLEITRGYPTIIVKDELQKVVGFAFLRPHHFAETFRRTAEITYFILPEHTRRGLGTALLEQLVKAAKGMGIDSILASVSSLNQASLNFHLRHGFKECGRFPRVGRKFGEDFDVVWMHLRID
ncbi:MAG: GNAT family N-acetyltransferase [Deltaproteobacteria bacterium]|nr:GNAT family N-acetyltransferase [Deltaproteobacteria bacterium]